MKQDSEWDEEMHTLSVEWQPAISAKVQHYYTGLKRRMSAKIAFVESLSLKHLLKMRRSGLGFGLSRVERSDSIFSDASRGYFGGSAAWNCVYPTFRWQFSRLPRNAGRA